MVFEGSRQETDLQRREVRLVGPHTFYTHGVGRPIRGPVCHRVALFLFWEKPHSPGQQGVRKMSVLQITRSSYSGLRDHLGA